MLTPEQKDLVKSTIPILESAGPAITEHFYNRLFSHHPELKNVFNMSHQRDGGQPLALFNAVAAYAKHIDDPSVLLDAVTHIAHKHISYDVQSEHYAVVGEHLLATLREWVGEAFTPQIEQAWAAAYGVLADIFVDLETRLYQASALAEGGWTGTRTFTITDKQTESDLVSSFTLSPVDGKAVMAHQPGQYLGLRVKPSGSEYVEIRQYSLSGASNGRDYRISVKREPGDPKGVVSNFLHDEMNVGDALEIFAPAGVFHWQDRQAPVVLISAGVGLTPMQSMLETLVAQRYAHPIHYLHACDSPKQHSFVARNRALKREHSFQQYFWYREGSECQADAFPGTMNLAPLAKRLPLEAGDFYLCGPLVFMQQIHQQLLALEVPTERIHYEVFGPHKSLN